AAYIGPFNTITTRGYTGYPDHLTSLQAEGFCRRRVTRNNTESPPGHRPDGLIFFIRDGVPL
ncbi:hypothetical protein ACFL6T_04170, partial [Candidatus Zixiibacteriota bacterium]